MYSTLYNYCNNKTSLVNRTIYAQLSEGYENDDCDYCSSDIGNYLINDYVSDHQSFMNEVDDSTESQPSTPKTIWGRNAWDFFHTSSFAYSDNPTMKEKLAAFNFFNSIAKMLPCDICSQHCEEYVQNNPPDVTNKITLSKWLVKFHNNVNKRLGKSEFSYEDAQKKIFRFKYV